MSAPAMEGLVRANGVRLWTRRHGDGPPLALLHGGPGLWDGFDALAPLIDDVVELHRYDQRGGGRSERVPPYDLATFVADLEALRAHWGHPSWVVGGHSAGVSLALAYAVAHPDRVRALVGISGSGVVDDWRAAYHANADARLTAAQRARRQALRERLGSGADWTAEDDREYCALTWAADFADRGAALDRARGLWRPWGPSYAVNASVNDDWQRLLRTGFAERVARLDAPALLVHGEEDPRPPALSERLARTLRSAHVVVVPGAGHWPWLERPGRVAQALRAFLAEHAGGPP